MQQNWKDMSWFNNPWQQNTSEQSENNFWQNDAQKWTLGQGKAKFIENYMKVEQIEMYQTNIL